MLCFVRFFTVLGGYLNSVGCFEGWSRWAEAPGMADTIMSDIMVMMEKISPDCVYGRYWLGRHVLYIALGPGVSLCRDRAGCRRY